MNYTHLLTNIDSQFQNSTILKIEDLNRLSTVINDKGFNAFLEICNGGFFFNRSLQIYSLDNLPDYNNIFKLNDVIKRSYGSIIKDEFFFAQEVFGNQFAFSKDGIIFFNIETGEKELIAKDFNDWIDTINADLDYFSGRNIALSLSNKAMALNFDQRLCPKKPFIIGGEYRIENLYTLEFPKYIEVNSNIANQIYNIPDGTPIKLKVTE